MEKIKGDKALRINLENQEEKTEKNPEIKEKKKISKEKKQESALKRNSNVRQLTISSETVVHSDIIGTPSDEILADFNRSIISQEEKDQILYRKLIQYQKYGEILWGKLIGVETELNHAIALIYYNGIIIKILDDKFFEPTYKFAVTYDRMSTEEKCKRKVSMLDFMLGANICFVLESIERVIEDYDDDMQYTILAVGNRNKAMAIQRDIYFFHKNRKETTRGTARTVNPGDVVQAHVIQVKEENMLVEALGVETRIPAGLLPALNQIENCIDYYKPGDILRVKVKKIYKDDNEETVHLSVTGRIQDPSRQIKCIKVKTTHLGTVESHNKEKNVTTIQLFCGVPAVVHDTNVFGHVALVPGDKVSVFVTNIYDTFVAGSATKI